MPDYRDRVVQVLTVLEGLPTIPRVIHEVLRLTASDGTRVLALAELIGEDQSLASRVLRVANSAYFGHSREIATISQAVLLIGFGRVRSAALAVATHHALGGRDSEFSAGLWRHALTTGEVAAYLATHWGAEDPEECAVAGLLHDVGKLALETICPAEYAQCRAAVSEDRTLVELESEQLGITHAEIGSRLLIHWNFPLPLVLAAAGHHAPERGEPHSPAVSLVHVASAVANRVEASSTVGGSTTVCWERVSEQLGMSEESLAAVGEVAVAQAEKADHFLASLS